MSPPDLLVLGFDTSAAHCAAALLSGDAVLAERRETVARGQSERLLPMLRDVLAAAQVGMTDLDAVAVGVGPGNFTGIRIAVAAARGIALGLGRPAVGVSGFEALRLTWAPRASRLVACLPAPRGGVLIQAFGDGKALGDPMDVSGEDAIAAPVAGDGLVVAGHQAAGVARRLGGVGGTAQVIEPEARGAPLFDAAAVARAAAFRLRAGGEIARPAPLYLRAPDARPTVG